MGPKGKGKKSEAVRETEEEAVARKQLQATEAKNQLKKMMELEESQSKVNRLRIMEKWRAILRTAKTEALKKEVEILAQNHEREVDRKDAILQMLDRFPSTL